MTETEAPARVALDARPLTVYTIHCAHCRTVHRDDESGQPSWWSAESLARLDNYGLEEDNWHVDPTGLDPDLEGRPLVCSNCWQVGWCEGCGNEIHAWQPREDLGTASHLHVACCRTDHVHPALTVPPGQGGPDDV